MCSTPDDKKPKRPLDILFKNPERIMEAASDGIVTLDKEGRYTYANASAERIFGIKRDKILQRTFNETEWKLTTLKGGQLPDEETPFRKAFEGAQDVYGMRSIVERPDGRKVVISTNAAPIYDATGHIDGVVGIFTDITEQYELQERNNAFLHTVAHDLRSPLTVIHGYAEYLLTSFQDCQVENANVQCAEEILKSAEKMEKMIEELLDTARIEGGHIPLQKKYIPLKPFVESLFQQTYQKEVEEQRILLRIPHDLPAVFADPDHLERILINLISNALKFSSRESSITIAAFITGVEIMISVEDCGKGITPKDSALLFQRFAQIKGARIPEGFGLGLYITRLLVEAHRGRIWIESKLNHGSIFNFTLPIEASNKGEEAP